MLSRNSSELPERFCISDTEFSHSLVRICGALCSSLTPLYIQCAAIPDCATWSISSERTCTSIGMPLGPNKIVCKDWYAFFFGMAM